jgi:hypothetical protein
MQLLVNVSQFGPGPDNRPAAAGEAQVALSQPD